MSIINSIVVGKAKGKVGNVVLVNLKGQQVMKSLNSSPANPKSVLQVASRGKMSNAVKAWQFLSIFLVSMNALRKSTESNYNAFVRLTKNNFVDVVASTGALAASNLGGLIIGSSSFVNVTSISFSGVACAVNFATSGTPFAPNTFFRCIGWVDSNGTNVVIEHLITEAEWLAGSASQASTFTLAAYAGAYIFNKSENKCSDLNFCLE